MSSRPSLRQKHTNWRVFLDVTWMFATVDVRIAEKWRWSVCKECIATLKKTKRKKKKKKDGKQFLLLVTFLSCIYSVTWEAASASSVLCASPSVGVRWCLRPEKATVTFDMYLKKSISPQHSVPFQLMNEQKFLICHHPFIMLSSYCSRTRDSDRSRPGDDLFYVALMSKKTVIMFNFQYWPDA